MSNRDWEKSGDRDWGKMSTASQLACFRNRVPLPGRPPRVPCFPHNYTQVNNSPRLMSVRDWGKMSTANQLACFRNRVPMSGRPPRVPCFPHNYTHTQVNNSPRLRAKQP